MEFMNRGGQQPAAANQAQRPAHSPSGKKKFTGGKVIRIISVVMLVSATLLLATLAAYVAMGGAKSEDSYVNKDKFQAVFLNGGQVYFGKIRTLNNRYVTMDNIYYLRVNQQVQPNQSTDQNAQQNVSLAKLGCELHGPEDSMVINREQVTFWENLKDDGQVVKAVNEFVKANPQGQKCTTPDASTQSTPDTTKTTDTKATTPTTTKKP